MAATYRNLGLVYDALKQYNEAKECNEKALVIMKNIFGEVHRNVALSYNNLGLVHEDLGQYNKGKVYHEKALIISKKVFGEEHGNVA